MPCLERSLRTASLALLLVYSLGTWPAAAQAPPTTTPLPTVTGPIPGTTES